MLCVKFSKNKITFKIFKCEKHLRSNTKIVFWPPYTTHTHKHAHARTHTGYVFFSLPYSVFPRRSRVLLFCLSVNMFLMMSPASPSPHLCLSPPRDQTLHLENPTVSGKVYTESLVGNINLLWGLSTIQSPGTPSCRKSRWLDDCSPWPFSHQQSCGNLGTFGWWQLSPCLSCAQPLSFPVSPSTPTLLNAPSYICYVNFLIYFAFAFCFLRQDLHSPEWLWTSGSPASTSSALGLQLCITKLGSHLI